MPESEKTAAPSQPGWLRRYGYSLLISVVAGVLTLWTIPDFNKNFFELFQTAVLVAAWYGGVGPGLLSAAVSFLIMDYFFIPPLFDFGLVKMDFMRLVIFEAVAMLTIVLSGLLRQAQTGLEQKIRQRTEELSQANQHLTREIAQRTEAEKAIMEISNREQRRLGQDLHDGLSQILTGVKFMSESLHESFAERGWPEAKRMSIIESQLGEALGFVDTVSRGLYPVELEVNGLMAALKELSEKMSRVYPVTCRFKMSQVVSVGDGAVANHLYRIAQEAVMNAVKGGKAARISLRLARRGSHFILSVADNGVGYGNRPMRKGMGIKMMEYRARVINGALTFRSRPRGGTLVTCTFPANGAI